MAMHFNNQLTTINLLNLKCMRWCTYSMQYINDYENYYSQEFDIPKYPNGPIGSVSYGPAGVAEPSAANDMDLVGSKLWNHWLDHIDMILKNQDLV